MTALHNIAGAVPTASQAAENEQDGELSQKACG